MSYNKFQTAYYTALYGAPKHHAPPKEGKMWGLFENGCKIAEGDYAFLVWKKKEMVRTRSSQEYLLKIKSV